MLKITKTTEKTKTQNYSSFSINHLLKPVKVAVYDIPQITDEKWNKLAEQNKILQSEGGVA